MAIRELTVSGYRSIRNLTLALKPVTVLVGPNGCGKSNLYRSLSLLAAAANGHFAQALAEEGGMPSILWAGARKKGVVRLTLHVAFSQMEYQLSCGMAAPNEASGPFLLDPKIKEETVWSTEGKKKTLLLERGPGSVWLRDTEGNRVAHRMMLSSSESVLTQLSEPHRYPQLAALREELLRWRFYHHFRTDRDAPARHPQIGVFTPVLRDDGSDLAAALQTILLIGDAEELAAAIDRAFPGSQLLMTSERGRFGLALQTPGLLRPLESHELSDGTLRYLCLLAALLTPRPPSLLALNEPETSLHPDMIEPLAILIARAASHSQLWITTHSQALADSIETHTGVAQVRLDRVQGETRIQDEALPEFVRRYGL